MVADAQNYIANLMDKQLEILSHQEEKEEQEYMNDAYESSDGDNYEDNM